MKKEISMLDPMMDFVFKALFGKQSETSKELLVAFLNDILQGTEQEKIKSITHTNPFNYKDFECDKLSILDIKATTEKGEMINIEIQVEDTANYRERSLYYWSKIYAESIKESESYDSLKKTIAINIMGYNIIKESNKIHTKFKILEQEEKFLLTDQLEIHYLELPKLEDKPIEKLEGIELWLYFLKEAPKLKKEDLTKFRNRGVNMEKLIDQLEEVSSDDRIREINWTRHKTKLDRIAQMRYAEKKGMEKGIEKGMEKGMEKVKVEMTQNLLRENVEESLIEKVTGLSKEQIEEIKNNFKKTLK